MDESKLGDMDNVCAIDASAATTAEDDVVADPSAAEMSESRVSVKPVEETLVEGVELGAKLESESSSIFSSSTHVSHVIGSDVTYAGYFALPHRKAAEEAGVYSRVALYRVIEMYRDEYDFRRKCICRCIVYIWWQ